MTTTIERLRRPLFGRYGHAVVAALCAYEVAAIASGRVKNVPELPTLTALGRRHPSLKWALSGALAHHFHVEIDGVVAMIEEAMP